MPLSSLFEMATWPSPLLFTPATYFQGLNYGRVLMGHVDKQDLVLWL